MDKQKGPRQCPTCHQQTLLYDSDKGRHQCTNCDIFIHSFKNKKQLGLDGSLGAPKNDDYRNFYKIQMNKHQVWVTNKKTDKNEIQFVVEKLASQGKELTVFTGTHGAQNQGNNSTQPGFYKYQFYIQDVPLEDIKGVDVQTLNFTQCPKTKKNVCIFATCFSGTRGWQCPKCHSLYSFKIEVQGKYICLAPNCGMSGYQKDFKKH